MAGKMEGEKMRKSRWQKIKHLALNIAAFSALTIFILTLLIWTFSPFAISYFANQTLKQFNLELDASTEIRYNPFLSQITFDTVAIEQLGTAPATQELFFIKKGKIAIHVWPLFSKQLSVKTFAFDSIEILVELNETSLKVAGIEFGSSDADQTPELTPEPKPEPTLAEQESAQPLAFSFALSAARINNLIITLRQQNQTHRLHLEEFSLADIFAAAKTQRASLAIKGQLNQAQLELGIVVVNKNNTPLIETTIALHNLDLATYASYLTPLGIEATGRVDFSAEPVISIDNNVISLDSKTLSLTMRDLQVKKDPFTLNLASQQTQITNFALSLNQGQLDNISAAVSLDFTQLLLTQNNTTHHQDLLLGWKTLHISPLTVAIAGAPDLSNTSLSIGNILMQELQASQYADAKMTNPALLAVGTIDLAQLNFSNAQLDIEQITIVDAKAKVQLDAQKNIRTLVTVINEDEKQNSPHRLADDEPGIEREIAGRAKLEDEAATEQSVTAPLLFTLGNLSFSGTTSLHFKDESVNPVYERNFFFDELQIAQVSNKTARPSPFKIIGRSDQYATFSLLGSVAPFTDKMNLTVDGNFSEFSLPALSPYIRESLGFELKTGELDSKVKLSINESELQGKVNLKMRGLDMSAANAVEAGSLKNQTAIPLNTALGMLADKRGNIKLDIPLRGSVDDPSFGLDSIFMMVAKRAVMSQARAYLMQTFVPYANLVSIAMVAGEYAMKLRFADLPYAAAQTEIGEAQLQYAVEFIKLMQDKPQTQVKICGLATASDIEVSDDNNMSNTMSEKNTSKRWADPIVRDQLLAVAAQRATNFKFYATQQGVESSRMLICSPQMDLSSDAQPRIEITL